MNIEDFTALGSSQEIAERLTDLIQDPSGATEVITEYMLRVIDEEDAPVAIDSPYNATIANCAILGALNLKQTSELSLPTQCTDIECLYKYIPIGGINNMYSKPKFLKLWVGVSVQSITHNNNQLTIPKYTAIKGEDGISWVVTEDIIITYDNDNFKINYGDNYDPDITPDSKVIYGNKVIDMDGAPWVAFNVTCEQVSIITVSEIILRDTNTRVSVGYEDNFSSVDVTIVTDTDRIPVPVVMSMESMPSGIAAYVTVNHANRNVNIIVPSMYTDNLSNSAQLEVTVKGTKGISVPRSIYSDNNNITVQYPYTVPSLSRLDIMAEIRGDTFGGRTPLSFEEIRSRVISGTLGGNGKPISSLNVEAYFNDHQLSSEILRPVYGTVISAAENGLADKLDVAIVNTAMAKFNYIEAVDQDYIGVNKGSFLTHITPAATFTVDEMNTLQLVDSTMVSTSYMGDTSNKFYTPFHYVIRTTPTKNSVRVYHLEDPNVNRLNYNVNNLVDNVINTLAVEVTSVANGYLVTLECELTNPSIVKLRLDFGDDVGSILLVDSTLDPMDTTRTYTGVIETNKLVSDENTISVTNATNIESTMVADIPLDTNIKVVVADISVVGYTGDESLIRINGVSASKRLAEIEISVEFGKELTYLWSSYDIASPKPVYDLATTDIYKKYDENIYSDVVVTNTCDIAFTSLHRIGDVMLDDDGNPIVDIAKGEPLLDENGEPIITGYLNVMGVDIVVFDAITRLVADNTPIKAAIDHIVIRATEEFSAHNKRLLSQTRAFYVPKGQAGDIPVITDTVANTVAMIPRQTIKVTVHLPKANVRSAMLTKLNETLAFELHKALGSRFTNFNDVATKVKAMYDSLIWAISIEGVLDREGLRHTVFFNTDNKYKITPITALTAGDKPALTTGLEIALQPH